jgi:hypothetical protein
MVGVVLWFERRSSRSVLVQEPIAEGGGGEGLAEVLEEFGQLKRLVFHRRRLDEAIRQAVQHSIRSRVDVAGVGEPRIGTESLADLFHGATQAQGGEQGLGLGHTGSMQGSGLQISFLPVNPPQTFIAHRHSNPHRSSFVTAKMKSQTFDRSPDRSQLAIGLTDGTVAVWNLLIVRQQLESIGLGWK